MMVIHRTSVISIICHPVRTGEESGEGVEGREGSEPVSGSSGVVTGDGGGGDGEGVLVSTEERR